MRDFWPAVAGDRPNRSSEEKLVAGSDAMTEDLVESVFLKAWSAMRTYQQRVARFSSWLCRIAHNTVINYHRTEREDLPLDWDPPAVAREGLDPEQLLLKREEVKELQHAISQLPEEQQEVIILRFVEGLSHAEVGEIMGKSGGACREIQHRGLAALSRLLG